MRGCSSSEPISATAINRLMRWRRLACESTAVADEDATVEVEGPATFWSSRGSARLLERFFRFWRVGRGTTSTSSFSE